MTWQFRRQSPLLRWITHVIFIKINIFVISPFHCFCSIFRFVLAYSCTLLICSAFEMHKQTLNAFDSDVELYQILNLQAVICFPSMKVILLFPHVQKICKTSSQPINKCPNLVAWQNDKNKPKTISKIPKTKYKNMIWYHVLNCLIGSIYHPI